MDQADRDGVVYPSDYVRDEHGRWVLRGSSDAILIDRNHGLPGVVSTHRRLPDGTWERRTDYGPEHNFGIFSRR